MITITEHADENTRTSNRSCRWIATTTINGETFTASSRTGAPHALARILVDAGIPDQPVTILSAGIPGHASCRSLHAMTRRTYQESATARIHQARFTESPYKPGNDPDPLVPPHPPLPMHEMTLRKTK